LDIIIKTPPKRWCEEREYLNNLYIEKASEAGNFEEYVAELEHILSGHELEFYRMSERHTTQTIAIY